jgi:ABC-type branched-subunit amino acid transport system substrate-binding protein
MDLSISAKSNYVFRFYEGMDKESEPILEYLERIKSPGLVVGILHSNAPVIKDVVDNIYIPFFKKNNINFKYNGEYTLNDKDFKNHAIQIKNNKINHLIILGHGFEYQSIYSALEDYKLVEKLNVLGGWGFIYTPVLKEKLEGTVIAGPKYVFDKDTTSVFYKSYKNKYKEEPNFDAAYAYNAIIELSKFKKEDFSHPIKNILIQGNYNSSIIGNYSFDENGNMIVPLGLGRMKNGRIESIN